MIQEIFYSNTTQTLSWTADPDDVHFKVELSNGTYALHQIYEGDTKIYNPLDITPMPAPVQVTVKGQVPGGVWDDGKRKILKAL